MEQKRSTDGNGGIVRSTWSRDCGTYQEVGRDVPRRNRQVA